MKARLRSAAKRTIAVLWSAIGKIMDLLTPIECTNYLTAAGYGPDLSDSVLIYHRNCRDFGGVAHGAFLCPHTHNRVHSPAPPC